MLEVEHQPHGVVQVPVEPGGEQQIFAAGLNWYLNNTVRLMLDFQHVKVDRLSPNAVTFQTPVGAQVGQSYNAVSMRTQYAF